MSIPPFIIADVGSNFKNFEDCAQSVKLAKACGADAVKFQSFSDMDLYGIQYSNEERAFSPAWLSELSAIARSVDIEFMCTAFSPDGVDLVDPFVRKHKIASAENSYPQLLDAVARKGKPVLISTGGSSMSDMALTLEYLDKKYPSLDITLLYCVSAYPSKAFNLFKLDELAKLGKPVGFSDHSLDEIYAPLSAVEHFGIKVLEKHFRLDRITQTPDAPHSLTPDKFKCMVDHIKGTVEVSFRSGEESNAHLLYNRRLIVTKDMTVGEQYKYGYNFGCYRSKSVDCKGLTPFYWEEVQEKRCPHRMPRGTPIGPKDFDK